MYTKQTWADGDIITAAKLNHIEQGIVDSDCKQFPVTVTQAQGSNDFTYTPDHTYSEVMSLINDGYYPVYRLIYITGEIGFSSVIDYTNNAISVVINKDTYTHDATGFYNNTLN